MIKPGLYLLNCFWLILPLLAWNLVLGPRITQPAIISDAQSQKWLLVTETVTRILVFALPLIIQLQVRDIWGKSGMVVYIFGTVVYFASWMPLLLAPESDWSNSPAGLLAPRLTPFLSFLGIALIGQAWPYGLLAAAFIFLHTWHGVQNL